MPLTDLLLKICGVHSSLSQKGSQPPALGETKPLLLCQSIKRNGESVPALLLDDRGLFDRKLNIRT